MGQYCDWIEVLSNLCRGDMFGHESWFVIGMEQHKTFYYCFIGDCSADEKDGWSILANGKPQQEGAHCYVGKDSSFLETAICRALASGFLDNLALYKGGETKIEKE